MTWLKWCGEKHQEFYNWAWEDDIPTWKLILRVSAFILVDSILWMIVMLGAICTFFALFGRFLPNQEEE